MKGKRDREGERMGDRNKLFESYKGFNRIKIVILFSNLETKSEIFMMRGIRSTPVCTGI